MQRLQKSGQYGWPNAFAVSPMVALWALYLWWPVEIHHFQLSHPAALFQPVVTTGRTSLRELRPATPLAQTAFE